MLRNRRLLTAIGFALIGWGGIVIADDDVTVISTATNAPAKTQDTADNDGTPVVHKSSHKKKKTDTAANTAATTPDAAGTAATSPTAKTPVVAPTPHAPISPQKIVVVLPPPGAPPSVINLQPKPEVTVGPAPAPSINTGMPVARPGVSTYTPLPTIVAMPPVSHLPYFASATSPTSVLPPSSAYGTSTHYQTEALDDFTFASTSRKHKNAYPWKTNIITTMFWIGEGATPVSSTTNVASSWDEDWRANNHGSDSPNDRNGYASGGHASTLNPFYVALPFNDLAFPDKTRRWLPDGWYRRPRDGKEVSACKDRWVEIKNSRGDICYAQWEDVGPLRYDQAEYVFGPERPIGLGDNHAGLDVSPAVAEYLGIDHKDRALTSWRFVDDEDVRPGAWLKLDEQAVLYTALHQLKNTSQPIEKESQPMEDQSDEASNKKKVDASKG
jgi:hypothetical protein